MWEKLRKLYYAPGLFSALFLPLIFYFYAPKPSNTVVINLFVPRDEPNKNGYSFNFSSVYLLSEFRKKKVLQIMLDEKHEQNKKKLEFFRHEARRIKYYNDNSIVIKVSFSNETTYEEVIDLLNILIADEHARYAVVGNDFYLFGELPELKPRSISNN